MGKILLVLGAMMLLAGCGGGGSSEPVTTEPVVVPQTETGDGDNAGDGEVANDDGAGTGDPEVATEDTETATEEVQDDEEAQEAANDEPVVLTPLDEALVEIIAEENLTGDPSSARALPQISAPIAQLGKLLFFSNQLGGENDTACVSCHHPTLGGADALSLSVGVHAVDSNNLSDPELLGPGRHPETAGATPIVPRNAPTVFNAGLWDEGMFWDSRIVSLAGTANGNGTNGAIATPDSDEFNEPDASLPAGTSLPAAQARFPVTSEAEMRGDFAEGDDNQNLRATLAERFNDATSTWSAEFAEVFGDDNITFDRIGEAIGEYERSMVFTDNPWRAYIEGDLDAITDDQKRGAVLFFTEVNDGGAGCVACHSGDTFSDSRHHVVGFPQLFDDRGRESVNGDARDRYSFRTPTLLNITTSGPYGHAGLYATLEEVIHHYDNPRAQLDDLFGAMGPNAFVNADADFCHLPQIARMMEITGEACEDLFPDAHQFSMLSVERIQNNNARNTLGPTPNLNQTEVNELVAFLEALTDPCVESRECLDPWIVDADDISTFPDNSALIAHDEQKLDL